MWPDSPDQPWTLLEAEEQIQLLQGAADAWQHVVQQKRAGQQPQPATEWVPWLPIEQHPMQSGAAATTEAPAAAAGQHGQAPAQQLDTELLHSVEQQQQEEGRFDPGAAQQLSAAQEYTQPARAATAQQAAGVRLADAAAVLQADAGCVGVEECATPAAAQSTPAPAADGTAADPQQKQQQQPNNLPLLDAVTPTGAKQQQQH